MIVRSYETPAPCGPAGPGTALSALWPALSPLAWCSSGTLGRTEAGNLPFASSASSCPGTGVRDALMFPTLPAFCANNATRTASAAACPSGVIPSTATINAAAASVVEIRFTIVPSPS